MGKLDILIVGGGPSSVSAICAIVDQAIEGDFCQKVRVIVVERSGEAGRGLAFGTTDDGHLTNMPAHSLRIPPREKHDFLKWAVAQATGSGEQNERKKATDAGARRTRATRRK